MQTIDVLLNTSNLPAERPVSSAQKELGYEDLFRALGQMLDNEGWSNVCVREHGNGLQVMAQQANDPTGTPVAFTLHRGDVRAMAQAAQSRRTTGGRATILLAAADAAKRA